MNRLLIVDSRLEPYATLGDRYELILCPTTIEASQILFERKTENNSVSLVILSWDMPGEPTPAALLQKISSIYHYCPVIERVKMPNTRVVIDDYRSLDLLTI